ncbi:MAG TPA: Crp/Fnr family transcriptional regulator [Candidatus Eisenbacteria bacterium]|nr:Crp/Fnr family transcriptional regulator [Candidatus Eisenbacteria bacterium]
MLTPVERVLILKGADLLRGVGPRHLLGLANVCREISMYKGDTIYLEADAADALYMVVEGRVRLSTGDRATSEVGPGEAFGTWSLVDDSKRGHRAECLEDGMALALAREDFYEVAAGDLTILTELVRVLAKRLRELAADAPPEEARVEGEGVDKTESMSEAEAGAGGQLAAEGERTTTAGAALSAAVAGKAAAPLDETPGARPSDVVAKGAPLEPVIAPESITPEEGAETPPTPTPPPASG